MDNWWSVAASGETADLDNWNELRKDIRGSSSSYIRDSVSSQAISGGSIRLTNLITNNPSRITMKSGSTQIFDFTYDGATSIIEGGIDGKNLKLLANDTDAQPTIALFDAGNIDIRLHGNQPLTVESGTTVLFSIQKSDDNTVLKGGNLITDDMYIYCNDIAQTYSPFVYMEGSGAMQLNYNDSGGRLILTKRGTTSHRFSGSMIEIIPSTDEPVQRAGVLWLSGTTSLSDLYICSANNGGWNTVIGGGGSNGVSNLSDLTIDDDKDWNSKTIYNVAGISSASISGGSIITNSLGVNMARFTPSSPFHMQHSGGASFGHNTMTGTLRGFVNVQLTDDDNTDFIQAIKMHANKAGLDTLYGFNGTAIGANTTNIGIYAYAGGATNNYGLYIDAGDALFKGDAYFRGNFSSQCISTQAISGGTIIGGLHYPANYVIYKEGSIYYVKDGTNGKLVSSSSHIHSSINYAIDSCESGSIFIKQGHYTLDNYIDIYNKRNIKLLSDGAEFELSSNYDANYRSHGIHVGLGIESSKDITIDGLWFNGNYATASGNNPIMIHICDYSTDSDETDRIYLRNINFEDSTEGDVYILASGATVNIDGCTSYKYGGGTTPYSIYTEKVKNLSVTNCHWDTYHPSGTPQCLYLDGIEDTSKFIVDNCTAKGIYIFASVRLGYSSITNCIVSGLKNGINVSVGDPFVSINNCRFEGCAGVAGDTNAGCYFSRGIVHIKDSLLTCKPGTYGAEHDAYYGLMYRYNNGAGPTRNGIVDGCKFEDFTEGIYLQTTSGNHIIRNSIFKDATVGIHSDGNLKDSIEYDNTFINVTTDIDNDDGFLNSRSDYDNNSTPNSVSSQAISGGNIHGGLYSSQTGIYADWVSGNNTNLVSASDYLKDNADDTTTGVLTAAGIIADGISGTTISGGTIKGASAYRGWANVSDAGTIAHGCPSKPSYVNLSPSGANPIMYSFTVDATNITVYHSSPDAQSFSWRAEV